MFVGHRCPFQSKGFRWSLGGLPNCAEAGSSVRGSVCPSPLLPPVPKRRQEGLWWHKFYFNPTVTKGWVVLLFPPLLLSLLFPFGWESKVLPSVLAFSRRRWKVALRSSGILEGREPALVIHSPGWPVSKLVKNYSCLLTLSGFLASQRAKTTTN